MVDLVGFVFVMIFFGEKVIMVLGDQGGLVFGEGGFEFFF